MASMHHAHHQYKGLRAEQTSAYRLIQVQLKMAQAPQRGNCRKLAAGEYLQAFDACLDSVAGEVTNVSAHTMMTALPQP